MPMLGEVLREPLELQVERARVGLSNPSPTGYAG